MRFLILAVMLTLFSFSPALAREEAQVTTGGWDAVLGLIVGFVVGAFVMFLFMRRNPHIIQNLKQAYEEMKNERDALVKKVKDFEEHIERELHDFPDDAKRVVSEIIEKAKKKVQGDGD